MLAAARPPAAVATQARITTPASTSYGFAARALCLRAPVAARQRRQHDGRLRVIAPDASMSDEDLQRLRRKLNRTLSDAAAGAPATAVDAAIATAPVADDSLLASAGWRAMPHHLSRAALWEAIRGEAKGDADKEPALASFLYSTILVHPNLEKTMAFLLANKLSSPTLLGTQLMALFNEAYEAEPDIMEACVADLQAVFDRDPACDKYTQCILYFKGFQAVQCHRIAHHLWHRGRRTLALALQSRMSEVLHVDIHPKAQLGRGILIDHATGVVIGETAVVGDNVSMLHHVTLGGSGTGRGVRHPTIGHGVLLGAGASVLGPIRIGAGTKIGAGSVVVTDLPTHCVAVGVPARIIKRDVTAEPCEDMDQQQDFVLDFVI